MIRLTLIAAVLIVQAWAPAYARQATATERHEMSVEIATEIRYSSRSFPTRSVELGPAAIEDNIALADWRAATGPLHGQVLFWHVCDHWMLFRVRTAPFRPKELAGALAGRTKAPAETAARLAADIGSLERQQIAYLKPAKARATC